jgi:integrase
VIVLLSAKAGLRACEIARLDWSMVLDARGEVGPVLNIEDRIAKKRGGGRIPLHPDLRQALRRLKNRNGGAGP